MEFRLLLDPPAAGPWNMAVDEALLETAASLGRATLRFYAWEKPTLSLGYFQAARERQLHAASATCPFVRRPSGGGAIIHDRELTYSIALPLEDVRSDPASRLYDACHETLVTSLSELGVAAATYRAPGSGRPSPGGQASTVQPFLCFQRRCCGDVVSEGFKVAGSAQRRRRRAVLQHGSILLARSERAPELPGILEIAGRALFPAELIDRWTPRLAERLGLGLGHTADLSPDEQHRATLHANSRFGADGFALRR
jgi:lipoate-protein ligase A